VITRLNMGGPAHQAALLSGRRFDPERFQARLIHGSLAPGEESMAYLAEEEGADTEFVPTLVQPLSIGFDARAVGSLISAIRRYRPHIVHTHTAKAGFVGRAAALAARPRPIIVHTFHGHVLAGYFGRSKTEIYRRIERRLGRSSDLLIGVSQATVDELIRLRVAAPDRFRLVRLGLDLDRYRASRPGDRAAARAEMGLNDEDVLVVFVGRVVPIKRLDVLLAAIKQASSEYASVHLAVVGDGEMRPDLERHAEALGLGERVHFLGYRRDLVPIFAAGDIAAVSSDNEGTPVSLIEAGAAGLPAVATNVGGVSEVVTPETGELVAPSDPGALGGAIARFANHPDARRLAGAHARERVVARYSASRLIADVGALYEDLLEQRRQRAL
jgi:glycosyltransferase involved in cell wall biosynthesis